MLGAFVMYIHFQSTLEYQSNNLSSESFSNRSPKSTYLYYMANICNTLIFTSELVKDSIKLACFVVLTACFVPDDL